MATEKSISGEAKGRIRLTFEFTPEVYEKLLEVKERSGSPSIVEVVRRALSIYETLTEVQAEGGKLIAVHRDGVQEHLRIL